MLAFCVFSLGKTRRSIKSSLGKTRNSAESSLGKTHIQRNIVAYAKTFLLYQPQEDIEVSENLTYKVVNGMPSILTTSTYGWQEGFDPAWPEDSALSIYKVRFFIGDYDFTGNESEGRIENETPHTNFNNVTFSIGTTMTY